MQHLGLHRLHKQVTCKHCVALPACCLPCLAARACTRKEIVGRAPPNRTLANSSPPTHSMAANAPRPPVISCTAQKEGAAPGQRLEATVDNIAPPAWPCHSRPACPFRTESPAGRSLGAAALGRPPLILLPSTKQVQAWGQTATSQMAIQLACTRSTRPSPSALTIVSSALKAEEAWRGVAERGSVQRTGRAEDGAGRSLAAMVADAGLD